MLYVSFTLFNINLRPRLVVTTPQSRQIITCLGIWSLNPLRSDLSLSQTRASEPLHTGFLSVRSIHSWSPRCRAMITAPLIYLTERKIRARSHQYFHFPERGCSEPMLTHLLTRSDLPPVGDSCLPTWLLFRLLNLLGKSVSLNACARNIERNRERERKLQDDV